MKQKIICKSLIVILILLFLTPSLTFAQTGNHFGEQKFLSYYIEHLSALGVTTVDGNGITYKPDAGGESHEDTILPAQYFGDYPLYFASGTMEFEVTIENIGPRTYRNLKIETFQEFLNIEGEMGEGIGDDNHNVWFIDRLGPGEEATFNGEFLIPRIGESGIDQTHLRISHQDSKGTEKGQVILEDYQAGLWCPVGV